MASAMDNEASSDAKFAPQPCVLSSSSSSSLVLDSEPSSGLRWVPVLEAPVTFQPQHFNEALEDILLHPERNTSLILRADILSDGAPLNAPAAVKIIPGYVPTRNLLRRLLPRQKNRDPSLDQDCTFLVPQSSSGVAPHTSEASLDLPTLVVLSPRFDDPDDLTLPWYHPPVKHLAFRYIPPTSPFYSSAPDSAPSSSNTLTPTLQGTIRLEVVLVDHERDAPLVRDSSSRLYRTCLALLETLYRYGRGKMTGYKKRVVHDTLVPKEEYQDLYMVMRDKFKDIADTWHEATDASKHVFEDISIATFLMLLWKHTYPPIDLPSLDSESVTQEGSQPLWSTWGRPSGGFLDFGCGNGLLVHILLECGYEGLGVDLRARKSWPHYPPRTQENLHLYAFDPTEEALNELLGLNTLEPAPDAASLPPLASGISPGATTHDSASILAKMFPPAPSSSNVNGRASGRFIIGNHADELQPWVPVLAALTDAEYLSIPCCAWEFDQRYQMKKIARSGPGKSKGKGNADMSDEGLDADKAHVGGKVSEDRDEEGEKELEELEQKLKHGETDGALSLYGSYVLWLAQLSRQCGFTIESEALRIPSTRNRALIGCKRRYIPEDEKARIALRWRMAQIIGDVRKRGMFKSRTPEGNAGLVHTGSGDADGHEGDALSETSGQEAIKQDGRPKEHADPIFRLKGPGMSSEGAPTPAEFRPTAMGWGSGGGVAQGVPSVRGRAAARKKSLLSS